jgi:large subunit ribosomal protein L10
VKKEDKEQVVETLTERLKAAETVLVADYRGLTMPQIDALRSKLIESGARFSVVKNTLTRRAAEAAGNEALLALLSGPSAIAFIESDGDMVAAAKALADSARETRVLAIRGGVMSGRTVSAEEVEALATLPPIEVLRGQVLGAIIAPLSSLIGLVSAPLQNLHGLIDARIEQLGGPDAVGTTDSAAPAGEAAEEGDASQAVATEDDNTDPAEDAEASDAEHEETD